MATSRSRASPRATKTFARLSDRGEPARRQRREEVLHDLAARDAGAQYCRGTQTPPWSSTVAMNAAWRGVKPCDSSAVARSAAVIAAPARPRADRRARRRRGCCRRGGWSRCDGSLIPIDPSHPSGERCTARSRPPAPPVLLVFDADVGELQVTCTCSCVPGPIWSTQTVLLQAHVIAL
jgi:hypothetical protein